MGITNRQGAVAYLALFLALGGTAVAKKGLFTGSDVEDGSLTGIDVADDSLTGADVDESTLGIVPLASQADTAFEADVATFANDCDTVDGLDSSSFGPQWLMATIHVPAEIADQEPGGFYAPISGAYTATTDPSARPLFLQMRVPAAGRLRGFNVGSPGTSPGPGHEFVITLDVVSPLFSRVGQLVCRIPEGRQFCEVDGSILLQNGQYLFQRVSWTGSGPPVLYTGAEIVSSEDTPG